MAAYPTITSYPPLRQLSVVPEDQNEIPFVLCIQWSRARPEYPFQIHLCHDNADTSRHASLWSDIPLVESSAQPIQLKKNADLFIRTFTTRVSRPSLLGSAQESPHRFFTFKFRVADNASWQWIYSPQGLETGELIFQAPFKPSAGCLSSIIQLEPGWKSQQLQTHVSGAALFSLESAEAIPHDKSGTSPHSNTLGLVNSQARFMALTQLEPPWIGPRHGDRFFHLSEKAVFCSFLRHDGTVVGIAAPSIGAVTAYFQSTVKGKIKILARDDGGTEKPFYAVLAAASTMEDCIRAIMTQLRAEASATKTFRVMKTEQVGGSDRDDESYEAWLDGLTFCTWNALGPDLTEDKILEALETLDDNGIKVSTLLIDDNWQSLGATDLDYNNPAWRGLESFKPSTGFPNGLDGLVSRIRREHPGIADIGVWHALFGYWGAMAEKGWIVDNYETIRVPGKMYYSEPATLRSVAATDLDRFYDDFYRFLASNGITFVKTDVQSLVNYLQRSDDRKSLIPAYQQAWMLSHQKHFGGKAISCMAQVPEMIWSMLLQNISPPIVLRNSDDFFPEIPGSHPWHLWANAHNALFTQHLNVSALDWDMFQTSHEYSAYHAAARCLSGGPIMITDVPGEHDLGLVDQMTAPSPDGLRSIALRTMPGKTPRAFDRYRESGLLKVVTETRSKTIPAGMMGIFNVAEEPVTAIVDVSEFAVRASIAGSGKFLLFSHSTQTTIGVVELLRTRRHLSPLDLIQLRLPVKGFEILHAHELITIPCGTGVMHVGVLGLLGKMAGPAAVTEATCINDDTGITRLEVELKALGTFALWIQERSPVQQQVRATLRGLSVEDYTEMTVIDTGDKGDGANQLLKIDLLRFWKDNFQGHGDNKKRAILTMTF